ncbi:hypothetical protein ACLVWU_13070 [Bdellovibrio sp. HCB290]|uniref:hypothetical protein n=1 Tax=Bdellovibrio sp. HCB290 TaxID=3394356 RepID=UPI0039B3E103
MLGLKFILNTVVTIASASAFAVGFIEASPAEKAQLEQPLKQAGFASTNLEISRLGGTGLSTYNFKLGQLSSVQFQTLKDFYRLPLNPQATWLEYNPQRSYELIDFLPPKMQAPLGKTFESSETVNWLKPLNGADATEYWISTNCWSTAYDLLSSMSDPFTSHLFMDPNDVYVAEIMRHTSGSYEVRESEVKPYDYVLYMVKNQQGQWGLDHVAVHIGLGLVYEKTGNTGGLDYYEIRPLKNVSANRIGMNTGTELKIEHRRLKQELPHPYKAWGAKAKGLLTAAQLAKVPAEFQNQIVLFGNDASVVEAYNRIRPMSIVANQQGRYVFDPRDPIAENFAGSRINGDIAQGTTGYSGADMKTPVCKTNESVTALVTGFFGQSFLVEANDYQVVDEAACKDSYGRAYPKFWIPANAISVH